MSDRDAFLDEHAQQPRGESLPPEAVEDAKFFAQRAEEGRALTFAAWQKWMREKYGIDGSRPLYERMFRDAGVRPWWRKKA